jgi:hypothetical protein
MKIFDKKLLIISSQKGQAVLSLLFFMTISISVVTAVVVMVLNSAIGASSLEQGSMAYYAAETGAENALLRLLRDPSYRGEILDVENGEVTIQVIGNTIVSTATIANSTRTIQVDTVYNNNTLSVTSWREIN